ncbi:MAG: flagellar hook-length control protein FliK [Deltaproteobacteria bacterium]|nr:flagellar hook-length control protein FliK [Deltaproteobacteria bacterium]
MGDLLTGRVVRVLGGSRVLMDIGGTELVGTTELPLYEGDQVEGVVKTKGPPIILKIVSRNTSADARIVVLFRALASRLLVSGEDPSPMALLESLSPADGDWFQPLLRWFASFALDQGDLPDPAWVRTALTRGGLFYEGKLRKWVEAGAKGDFQEAETDLKALALKLLGLSRDLGKEGGSLHDRAVGFPESLVDRLEFFQTANLLARQQGLGLLLQIPFFFGSTPGAADLLVRLPRGKGRKGEGILLVVLLSMGGLGRFQIEGKISNKGVTIRIGIDQEETVTLVRSMAGDLKEGLQGHGLTVLGMECFLLERPLTRKALLKKILLPLDRLEGVNIRV